MSAWQPISTAPKTFDTAVSGDNRAVMLWALNIWGQTRWTFGYWINEGDDGSGWYDCAERAFCTPTHWMPLPDPPLTPATSPSSTKGEG